MIELDLADNAWPGGFLVSDTGQPQKEEAKMG